MIMTSRYYFIFFIIRLRSLFVICHRDITFHHGAANKSNQTRKYLHIFLSEPTTRWVDFFEVKNNGVFMVNSFQEMMGLNRVLKSIR